MSRTKLRRQRASKRIAVDKHAELVRGVQTMQAWFLPQEAASMRQKTILGTVGLSLMKLDGYSLVI